MNSASFPFSDCFMVLSESGSPCRSAFAIPCACSIRMCGGSGGTSGSVIASSSTGPSAASARSHAGPTWSGLSTRIP